MERLGRLFSLENALSAQLVVPANRRRARQARRRHGRRSPPEWLGHPADAMAGGGPCDRRRRGLETAKASLRLVSLSDFRRLGWQIYG